MTDSEGAPIYGGVTDPADTSGPGLRYVPTIIFSCPTCVGDLQDEGRSSYYCPACQASYLPAQVATFDETDYERD